MIVTNHCNAVEIAWIIVDQALVFHRTMSEWDRLPQFERRTPMLRSFISRLEGPRAARPDSGLQLPSS